MVVRHRNRNVSAGPGGHCYPVPGYEDVLSVVDQGGIFNGWDDCYDVADNPGGVNYFFLQSKSFNAGSFSGRDGPYYDALGWIISADASSFQDLMDVPTDNTVMTNALAKTAPYVADWSVMNAIFELKDFRHLPFLIHDMGHDILHGKLTQGGLFRVSKGRNVPQDFAGDYLFWQFGIQPLISDLKSLLKFQQRSDARVKDFNSMSKPGGGTKNATIYNRTSDRVYTGSPYCTGVYGAVARYNVYLSTIKKKWGSVHWEIPASNLPPRTDPEYAYLAAQLANGARITPDTLWQAMPWTWLFDWFSNMNDFIKLSANTIGAVSGRYCVMDYTRVQCHVDSGVQGFNGTDGAYYYYKQRTPTAFVYPEVRLPFLSNQQAGILSALAVQRAPRR